MTPRERLEEAGRMLESHINGCPTGPERNALTEANIAIMVGLAAERRVGKHPALGAPYGAAWAKPKVTRLVAGSAQEPGEDSDPGRQ